LEKGTTCFEEQKLQNSVAKNKELQDVRLDAKMFVRVVTFSRTH
jgi:hypothetical protein